MISKSELLQEIKHEIHILRHLSTKIDENVLSWRPTEKQRTVLELIQYLSHIVTTYCGYIKNGDMDIFKNNAQKSTNIDLLGFKDSLDIQEKEIGDLFESITDSQWDDTLPRFSGGEMTKKSIIFFLYKNLLSYKMQLFLYLKQAGRPELNTMNVWMGVDPQ